MEHAQIYCTQCKDYVYDQDFEAAVKEERNQATMALRQIMGEFAVINNAQKNAGDNTESITQCETRKE